MNVYSFSRTLTLCVMISSSTTHGCTGSPSQVSNLMTDCLMLTGHRSYDHPSSIIHHPFRKSLIHPIVHSCCLTFFHALPSALSWLGLPVLLLDFPPQGLPILKSAQCILCSFWVLGHVTRCAWSGGGINHDWRLFGSDVEPKDVLSRVSPFFLSCKRLVVISLTREIKLIGWSPEVNLRGFGWECDLDGCGVFVVKFRKLNHARRKQSSWHEPSWIAEVVACS